jgi:imidazolonepropionase-like amidohydrolase
VTRMLARIGVPLLAAAGVAQAPSSPVLAIVGVTVVDATGQPPAAGRTVLVRDGRIRSIVAADAALPPDVRRLDGAGRYLVPALIDAHVHLAVRPESEAATTVLLPLLVAHGVLAARDMGGDLTRLNALRASVAAGHLRGPTLVVTGPFVDGPQGASPIVRPVRTPAEAAGAVRAIAAQHADFIKVQAGLTPELWAAAAAAARAAGRHVVGHVPEAMSAFDVVRGGQRTVEHVSPALAGDAGLMLAVSRDEPALRQELRRIALESRGDSPDHAALRARQRELQRRIVATIDPARSAELFALMRDRGVIAVPTLVWSNGVLPRHRQDRSDEATLALVPRALRERWLASRAEQLKASDAELALNEQIAVASRSFVGEMYRAGVTIAAGTDSFDSYLPTGLALHRELEELVASGLTPYEALQAGTRAAAHAMGRLDERGTIEIGKRADLLLLDADPTRDITATRRIRAVIHGGLVLDAADIATMLDTARTAAAQ